MHNLFGDSIIRLSTQHLKEVKFLNALCLLNLISLENFV
jgi:hypothetical protein